MFVISLLSPMRWMLFVCVCLLLLVVMVINICMCLTIVALLLSVLCCMFFVFGCNCLGCQLVGRFFSFMLLYSWGVLFFVRVGCVVVLSS